MLYLAKEAPSPLREEFAAMALEMGLGASPEEALAKFARSFPHPDFTRFLEAYRLSRRAGANLVHLYKVQLEGIEERHRLSRRLDSMTAQARLSGLMMGLLPVMLLGVLFVMDADLLRPLVERPAGWAVLALAVGLETLGFLWIQKLLRVEL
jgi:tight adherence protein B